MTRVAWFRMMKRLVSDWNLWIAACLLFIAGILLPMFTFHSFLVFNDRFSLLGAAIYLFQSKEWFLFAVISLFSILAPIYKLYLLGVLIRGDKVQAARKTVLLKRLLVASKWSMADVFVVAVVVSTVKLGIMSGVSVHSGVVVFGGSVLLAMWLVHRQMAQYEFTPKRKVPGK